MCVCYTSYIVCVCVSVFMYVYVRFAIANMLSK